MWKAISRLPLLRKKSVEYTLQEDEEDLEGQERGPDQRRRMLGFISLFFCVVFIIGVFTGHLVPPLSHAASEGARCPNPAFRMEWRNLSTTQQDAYISAVSCLRDLPSRLGLNQSLYDDFPYVHFRVGGYCASLPSHRTEYLSLKLMCS